MPAKKTMISPDLESETAIALKYREIKRIRNRVTKNLEHADDDDFNNSTIADIFAAGVYTAVDELKDVKIPDFMPAEENIETVVENTPLSAKEQIEGSLEKRTEDNKYMKMLKGIGHAGFAVLNYAMIPIKALYNWIVDKYFKNDAHKDSLNQALKNPDVRMGELNKKTGYDIEKVKKRIYTAIAYIATGIINAVKTRFINDEKKRKNEELRDRMEKFDARNDFERYEPVIAKPTLKPKIILPYVLKPIADNKKRAVVIAVINYMDVVDYEKAEMIYFNRQKGNIWAGKAVIFDERMPRVHNALSGLRWKAEAMRQGSLGLEYTMRTR